jgi:hypothetical protein
MAECECLAGCIFFNDKMKGTEGIGAIYKKKYCLGDSSQCARHMVFGKLGKAGVPVDMYPNMTDYAVKILAGK